jgi:hypothetical protein
MNSNTTLTPFQEEEQKPKIAKLEREYRFLDNQLSNKYSQPNNV